MIKRIKDLLVIFIVFLLCFSFINQVFLVNVSAQDSGTSGGTDGAPTTLIGKLLYELGFLTAKYISPINQWNLEAPQAKPAYVEVGYGENATFEVGLLNLSSGEFGPPVTSSLFNIQFLTFEVLEYPGNNNEVWTIYFNPQNVVAKKGIIYKTNVTVSLKSPPVLSNAIQSGMLKIRMTNTIGYGSLWFPPKGSPGDTPLGRLFWFISATPLQMNFGRYSGTVSIDEYDIEVLVKVKPYHKVKFDSVPSLQFEPNKIVSVPITLQNMGNYNDTYSFRVVSDSDNIKISDPISITLAPGETKNTYLGVAVPPNAFDYGTLHKIKIEAFSIAQPNITIGESEIYLETKGLYVSEMGFIIIIFFILIIFIGAGLLMYRPRLLSAEHCVKPDKPWDIPEENEYLEKLKKEDPDKYKETMKMMEDEYESSLLWYKYYCESIVKSKQRERQKLREEKLWKRKLKEEKVEKPVEKEVKTIEEVTPEEPKKIVKEELLIDTKKEAERLKKERALLKITRDQEKQRKKLSRSSTGKGG